MHSFLSFAVVCSLSIFSAQGYSDQIKVKDYLWLKPGEKRLLSDGQDFHSANATKSYTMMGSGVLSLYCNYHLPCKGGASVEYLDANYDTVTLCSDSWKATPIIEKQRSLAIDFNSGSSGNGKYNCLVINGEECTAHTTTKSTTTIETTTKPTTATLTTTKPMTKSTTTIETTTKPTTTTETTTKSTTTIETTTKSTTTIETTTMSTTTMETITMPITTIIPETNLSCQCGTISQLRIVNGEIVKTGEIPWQVGLGYDTDSTFHVFCGGTLLSDRYVLTAAHCIDKSNFGLKVMMGTAKLYDTDRVIHEVSKFIVHESFMYPRKKSNDIGLVHLTEPVTYSNTIFPACLPRGVGHDFFVGKTMTISGWGRLRQGSDVEPVLMSKASVTGVKDEYCKNNYTRSFGEGMMCAYGEGQDTCQGDSGGPMTFTDGPVTYIVGVTSFGNGCAKPGVPGVYSKVTHFLNWIDSKTDNSICSKSS